MIFERKYPLYFNRPWDDGPGGGGAPREVVRKEYIATDGMKELISRLRDEKND